MQGSAEGVAASGLEAYEAAPGEGQGVDSDESEPLLADGGASPRRCGCLSPKYALGLAMIAAVVIIWVAASALVQVRGCVGRAAARGGPPTRHLAARAAPPQYIYQELHWDGPFFLTYLCNTLFAVYLPMVACSAALKQRCASSRRAARRACFDPPRPLSSSSRHHTLRDDADAGKSAGALGEQLSFHRTARAALIICPMWFVANFSYNASLAFTSVTVNTILSTASRSVVAAQRRPGPAPDPCPVAARAACSHSY